MLKEFKNVLDYEVIENNILILQEIDGERILRNLNNSLEYKENWSVKNDYYSFQIFRSKIYSTTSNGSSITQVLSLEDGSLISDRFEVTFHFKGMFKGDTEYLCVADFKGEKVYVLFDIVKQCVVDTLRPPVGINNVSKIVANDYFLSLKKGQVNLYKFFVPDPVWEFSADKFISDVYDVNESRVRIQRIENTQNEIILLCTDLKNNLRDIIVLDKQSGKLKWHRKGYNNFELFNGLIYNLEFEGLLRVVSVKTGELETHVDLSQKFKKSGVNCDYRFKVTETHILFKYGTKGKIGVLSLKNFEIEDVIQLPEGHAISKETIPYISDNILYIKSSPLDSLFIFEKE